MFGAMNFSWLTAQRNDALKLEVEAAKLRLDADILTAKWTASQRYSRAKKLARRPRVQRGGKCESCGSREFVDHHGIRICSYCRSEAP